MIRNGEGKDFRGENREGGRGKGRGRRGLWEVMMEM